MTNTNAMIEKMTANRTRSRLAHGETNERRLRNDKRHKPERVAKIWSADRYEPSLNKRIADRKRSLHHQAAYAFIED